MSRKFNAMLGLGALAAFGFASSAFAQCPSSPVPPWSSQTALAGSLVIASGGYDSTSCRLDAQLTGSLTTASAFVRDDTPSDEARYRAQFLLNADNLTGLNLPQSVKVFGASTEAPASGLGDVVRLTISGNVAGTQKNLNIITACAATTTCAQAVPLAAGTNRIEIDWVKGASGSLKVWVNNTNEASPTATLNVDNSAWGGVDYATLGLSTASPNFRSGQTNRTVGFDEFDSRRSTFIGN
ncbi:hypothetical protein [Pseudofulvimonas gallinarii]|uniref:Uncharacterized protein n=2 Tax=Pseudofulvimonas gallinarii TaxID=634155 RepID=A0A4R3LLI8_9GAMM|nr:hypothetical protein [Pseudofulvimonas gallinarii]TCT00801.1 hypothetical protein EDC25_102167 [Pseudofulvimonas gallinarii]